MDSDVMYNLKSKIYLYLQKIVLHGLESYNYASTNKLVLNDTVLLQSFVKSKIIFPEIINNPNLTSYDITSELLLNNLDDTNTEAEINSEIENETEIFYNLMITKLYHIGIFIDFLLLNLNAILIKYGFTLNLQPGVSDLFQCLNKQLSGPILNDLYKRFIRYQLTKSSVDGNKSFCVFYLSLIRLSDKSEHQLRFLKLSYKINNITNNESFSYLCCGNNESDIEYSTINSRLGLPEYIPNSYFCLLKNYLLSESLYKFLSKLHYLGYSNRPGTILGKEKNKKKFLFLRDKIYQNNIDPIYRTNNSSEKLFFENTKFLDTSRHPNKHFFEEAIPISTNNMDDIINLEKYVNSNDSKLKSEITFYMFLKNNDNNTYISNTDSHNSIIYHYSLNSSNYNLAIIKYYLTKDRSYLEQKTVYKSPVKYIPGDSKDMTYNDYHTAIKDVFTNLYVIEHIISENLPDEYYVYRGIGLTNINHNNMYEKYNPGDIIINPTACSTTTELSIAAYFLLRNKPSNCGIFRILLKKNDNVIFMSDHNISYHWDEGEVLLPPECKFRIIKLSYVKLKDFSRSYNLENIRSYEAYYEYLKDSPILLIDVEYIEPEYITEHKINAALLKKVAKEKPKSIRTIREIYSSDEESKSQVAGFFVKKLHNNNIRKTIKKNPFITQKHIHNSHTNLKPIIFSIPKKTLKINSIKPNKSISPNLYQQNLYHPNLYQPNLYQPNLYQPNL
jgi:hypothetical protein